MNSEENLMFIGTKIMGALTIKELRKLVGMTQKEFSNYFGIPKRTIENWESNTNKCPDYLYDLIKYKLKNEGLIK